MELTLMINTARKINGYTVYINYPAKVLIARWDMRLTIDNPIRQIKSEIIELLIKSPSRDK